MKKGVLIGLVVVLTLTASTSLVWATPARLYVDDDGVCGGRSSCYTTIGAAMSAARGGDTILVFPGTYNEQVTVDKDVTLRGLGFPKVIGSPRGFEIHADGATVQGFRIKVPDGIGILVAANDVTVRRNRITGGGPGDPTNDEAGIYVMATGFPPTSWPPPEATGLTIKGNTIRKTTGPGVVLNRVAGSTVAKNRVRNISGDGIQVLSAGCEPSHHNIIERNTIIKVDGHGIKLVNSNYNTVRRNRVIKSTDDGMFATDAGCVGETHDNTIIRNIMRRNGDGTTTFDAHDLTTGSGTADTANSWTKNACRTDDPDGLCKRRGRVPRPRR